MRRMDEWTGTLAETSVGDLTAALASAQPAPGGGTAAAVVASLAASLTSMVVRLSLDRPRYQQHSLLHAEALAASEVARTNFLKLAEDDADAYAGYREARGMPHATDTAAAAREAATREAARRSAEVPLTVVGACHRQAELVERLAGRSNTSVGSDLDVAALLLEAAARGAAANVLVNLASIGDEGYSAMASAQIAEHLQEIQGATARTRELVARGELRPPEAA
jgi:formiminotetrahydrofolate cyclodeaminase